MTKAVLFPLPLILLLAATAAPAQTSSSDSDAAIREAVMRQADTILLRQKLDAASAAAQSKDYPAAAKLYEEAYSLVQAIGVVSIPQEAQQTIAGLTAAHMELARQAQKRGDLLQADVQVSRVLTVNPQDAEAIAFKKQNDQLIAQTRGQKPDPETLALAPAIQNQKTDAATLARDGQMLYEMGKLEQAEAKLVEALRLDPENRGAYYYLELTKQARYAREDKHKDIDNDDRMVQVERAWEKPVNVVTNFSNPYFQTNLVFTGQGRQAIYTKLNNIHLDSVSYQTLPLSEVIRNLREQTQLRDPNKQGINFLFNPNIESIPSAAESAAGGLGGGGGRPGAPAATIDPATGLPVGAPQATQPADDTQINISLQLNGVGLADLLNAICLVSDHPIKYSVEEYGVVFSQKGPDSPQYEMRTFKVDPNTFYSGLQNVNSFTFGSVNLTSSGSGGGGGGGSSGGSGQSQSGAVVPVVDVSPGASSVRQTTGGNGGGGGGGGGNTGGGGGTGESGPGLLQNPLTDLSARVQSQGGGLLYVTTPNLTRDVSGLAKQFFSSLGVNLDAPKTVFFNDRLGVLFVYATPQDLDIIEKAIQVLNQVPPMVHLKTRFIDVQQTDQKGLGFDWYLGQFSLGGGGAAVAQGGTAGSVAVPVSGANPEGTFPGNPTLGTTVAGTVQSLTQGTLPINSSIPAVASITGILTQPNFQVVLHALQTRAGSQELAEPEVTTLSGRQTEMRATIIQPVVTGFNFQAAPAATSTSGTP